jgi:hypothetical protein
MYIYILYATPCWACWAVQDFVENRLRTWSYVCFKNKPYIHGLITIFHSKIAICVFFPLFKSCQVRSELQDSCHAIDKQLQETTKAGIWRFLCSGGPKKSMVCSGGPQKIPWKSLQGTPWIPKALVEAKTSKKVYTHMCERTALETWLL